MMGVSELSRAPLRRFVWLIPVLVALMALTLSEKHAIDLIGAVVAVLILIFMINRPGVALITLIIFLPIEEILFGFLYKFGVPGAFLRPASSIKEVLGIALVISGLRAIRDSRIRLDKIDIALLLYVAVVTLYLIVPHLFSDIAPTGWTARSLAWRSDCGYVLVFFGARHAPFSAGFKNRFLNVLIAMGALVAGCALYQRLDPTAWQNFVLHTADQLNFQFYVLHSSSLQVGEAFTFVFQLSPLHVSSLFYSPYDLGDYLVLIIAVVAERIGRNHRSPVSYLVLAMAVGALFFTASRSDALAALVVLALIALPSPRRPVEGRVRFIGAIVVGALIIVPSLGGSRFVGAQGGSVSNSAHITEIEHGIDYIVDRPLGLGLGDQPSTATRFVYQTGLASNDISDNSVTQVGDELGLQAMIPWLFMVAFVLLELRRRAKAGDNFAAALGLGLLGIFIAGEYHHAFLTFPVPWTVWAGAGLALSVHRPDKHVESTEAMSAFSALGRVP